MKPDDNIDYNFRKSKKISIFDEIFNPIDKKIKWVEFNKKNYEEKKKKIQQKILNSLNNNVNKKPKDKTSIKLVNNSNNLSDLNNDNKKFFNKGNDKISNRLIRKGTKLINNKENKNENNENNHMLEMKKKEVFPLNLLDKIVQNNLHKIKKEYGHLESDGHSDFENLRKFYGYKNNGVNQISWCDFLLNSQKREKEVKRFENAGISVNFFEELRLIKNFPNGTIIITNPNQLPELKNAVKKNNESWDNIMGIILWNENKNFQYDSKELLLGIFDDFDEIFKFVLMIIRFYNRISSDNMIIFNFGFTYTSYHNNSCICLKHLNKWCYQENDVLDAILTHVFQNSYSLGKIENEYDILKEILLQEAHHALIPFFVKETAIFRIVNTILISQDIKFYKFISPIIKLSFLYFETPKNFEDKKFEPYEIYRKIQIDYKILNKFENYIEKEKYYFFPGYISGTLDRKSITQIRGNVLLNIKIEPDYIYECITLFSEKSNCIMPKKVDNLNEELELKKEVMIPPFYPFKVKGIKKINQTKEVFISCPYRFHYTDNDLNIINEDSEINAGLKDFLKDLQDDVNFDVNFKSGCSLKDYKVELTYEIDYLEIFIMNYEKFIRKYINPLQYFKNNDIILKARNYKKEILISKNKVKELPHLLALIHTIKNNRLNNMFNYLVLNIENIETKMPSDMTKLKGNFYYRIILSSQDSFTYITYSHLNDMDLTTNFNAYENFFCSLDNTKEVFLNFCGIGNSCKEKIDDALRFFYLTKKIPNINLVYMNLNCNQFSIPIIKNYLDNNKQNNLIKHLTLKLDCCFLTDADAIFFNFLPMIQNLEYIYLSCEKNKLTNNSLNYFSNLNKLKKLKNLELYFGGNYQEEVFFKGIKDCFHLNNVNLKVYDKCK